MYRVIKAATQKMTYELFYEPYERYGSSGPVVKKVRSASDRDLLENIHDRLMYGSVLEDDPEATVEDMIERLDSLNGDGCSMIYYIKNLTTGEELYRSDYQPEAEEDEEDW